MAYIGQDSFNAVAKPYETPATAPRQTEVEAELGRLEQACEQLAYVAGELGSRLGPVRRQTLVGNGQKEASASEPVLCDLANTIRRHRQNVEAIAAGLQTALSQLEI